MQLRRHLYVTQGKLHSRVDTLQQLLELITREKISKTQIWTHAQSLTKERDEFDLSRAKLSLDCW